MAETDQAANTPQKQDRRFGVVAVIGAPNAGKSTLVNQIVGAKVAIVTQKVQTTRVPVRGVLVHEQTQIAFVDTPGLFRPKKRLERAMVKAAWAGASDVDAIFHVVDAPAQGAVLDGGGDGAAKRSAQDTDEIITALKDRGKKALLVLNKVDTMARPRLLALSQHLWDTGAYEEIFMVSALNGSGVDKLIEAACARAPLSPWHYDEDQIADLPMRLLAAEITREKLMLRVHDEIPYEATVENENWQERRDGSVRIDQVIYVRRDTHKGIVLGEGGSVVKWIGEHARKDLIEVLGRPVHLFLHVKTREDWQDERERYRALGLEYDV